MSGSQRLGDEAAASGIAPLGLSAMVLISCGAILAIFSADSLAALVLWSGNSAYSYCFLIAPISLFLLYASRADLRLIEPRPSLAGAGVFLACLGLWAAGQAAAITEIRQFAVVGMLQGVVLGLLGRRFYRRAAFALLYLFLMVPTAGLLLAPLQDITTALAASLLGLSGIPVLTGRHVIEVPHGLYQVAPGCAGLNFLLSSLALSLLYGWMMFRGWAKRAACVAAALGLAIATNAVRVFGIIWLAEATDRKIDIVDDHLLYGWGVYAATMLPAVLLASLFRDAPEFVRRPAIRSVRVSLPWAVLLIAPPVLALAAGLLHAWLSAATAGDFGPVRLTLPDAAGEWRSTEVPPPLPSSADGAAQALYRRGDSTVELGIAYFWRQRQGHKIGEVVADLAGQGYWRVESEEPDRVVLGSLPVAVRAVHLSHNDRRRLIWFFVWIGGRHTASLLAARLLGAASVLGGDARSALVTLSVADDGDAARAALQDFCRKAIFIDPVLAGATPGSG